jgi:hypothetical protein
MILPKPVREVSMVAGEADGLSGKMMVGKTMGL